MYASRHAAKSFHYNQIAVLLLTFFAYAAFHASRKAPSIVKSVLGPQVSRSGGYSSGNGTGWAPFNGKRGIHHLGEIDLAFLSAYSVGMYFSGQIADRIDLRLFLVSGMLGSAILTVAFGLTFWLKIHCLGFFLAVQIVSGLFQSTGWPCVVSIVGNWFPNSKRGLIMGTWNSHTSVGNIIGSVLASSVLAFGWGWSFIFPGIIIGLTGLLIFKFLPASPEAAVFEMKDVNMESISANSERTPFSDAGEELQDKSDDLGLLPSAPLESAMAIGFMEAWRLPGVGPYAFSLFFSKLVAYTFLYWLPFYIRHTAVAGVYLTHKAAGMLSTIFDVGGVCGGVTAGYVSDITEAHGTTAVLFFFLSVPVLTLFRVYGSISTYLNVGLMFLTGFFVNGPYSLITTAVAADLGTQSCIQGNSRALATVTAIIDGTGSIGAALGPLLTGYISSAGWDGVFLMLISATILAGLLLIHIAKAEIRNKIYGHCFWTS